MSELPIGWIETELGNITEVQSGIGFPKKYQGVIDAEYPVYKVGDLSKAFVHSSGLLSKSDNYVSLDTLLLMKGKTFEVGSTLFAKIGEALKLNRRVIVERPGIADNNVMGVKAFYNEADKYVYRYLQYFDVASLSRSTTVPSIRKSDVEEITIPLPPLNEQIRIANKLDSILAKVDKAQARLDKIPAILKRFRQSVLAAATSGELTKEWRAENPSATSNSILDELSSFKFDARTKKLVDKEIRPDEMSNDLPSGWKWVRLCGITDVVSGVAKGSKTKEETVSLPYLRVANVQRGYLDLSEVKYIDVAQSKGENLKLEKGDVLFNEGGDIDKLGRGWVWEGQIEDCIHQNHVFRARILSNKIQPKYLSFYGNESARDYFLREGTQTVNLANLNKTTLSLLPVPLPPEEEQVEIVRQVDRLFNKANKLEKQYLDAKARLDRLTQSILAKAFRGELVPQDPNDEPAEKLLERIVAEKEQSNAKKTTRKRATKAKTAEKE
ncbi:restriction endonuclease subunit S [Vibrio parahaemolyticus]|nr:restriction endonuclease subunit S [Vibrio parahaemolyticus]